ncbi:MAG: archaetidylinositol phosphate synthase [Promethearchaeati archaeon SRVP18_Atabeyarchaeia-1]
MISKRKDKLARFFRPFAKMLEKMHLTPNAVTFLGFLLSLLIVPFTILLNYNLAGIMILITGLFDALDGALARLTDKITARGGFLDSVLDRYSDAIIMIAIIFAGLCNVVWGFVALIGSLLVSYSKARVEAFGVKHFVVGFAERPVRLLMIALAFFLENWYPKTLNYAIIALAILTHLTVLQRSIMAKDVLSGRS